MRKISSRLSQEHLELRILANAIRRFLGLGPLYDRIDEPRTDLERFALPMSELPESENDGWGKMSPGPAMSFRDLKELGIQRAQARRALNFKQGSPP